MSTNADQKPDGLKGRSIRSALLTGLSFGSANLLRLAGNLILTRLLFPEVFGIMALVQVVMTGLSMFSDIGVRASIVQNARGTDTAFLNTAWTLQIARGVLLWAATWVMAAPVAAFYETPILAQLLPVAGLAALFQGLNSTKLALANRALTLGRVTVIEIGAAVVNLGMIIALAVAWESVWALVIGSLTGPFLIMVLSHLVLPGPTNRLRFDPAAARDLMRFGKYIFLSTLAGFLISQADRAILGKFVSLSDLALYNIAFLFASIPLLIQRRMNDKVIFPLYSRRPPRESPENYRNIARARFLMIAAAMALASVLAVAGNPLIIWLYDPRYEAAGVLVVLIAVATLPNLAISPYGAMILAAGDSGRFAAMMILLAGLRTVILLVGISQFGVIGAALSPLVATLVLYPLVIWFIRPYGGWVPRHDLVFSVIATGIGTVAIWVNWDTILHAWDLFATPLR